MAKNLLEVDDLHTYFKTVDGTIKAVNGVSFEIEEQSVLGMVGESGSGKTVTGLSIMQLVGSPGEIEKGNIRYEGQELLGLAQERMRALRGKDISMVFQNASTSLNPVVTVGEQITEVVHQHMSISQRDALRLAESLLTEMGIPDAAGLMRAVPRLDSVGRRLQVMQGALPKVLDPPDQCPYLARCSRAINSCRMDPMPPLEEIGRDHKVACYNPVNGPI